MARARLAPTATARLHPLVWPALLVGAASLLPPVYLLIRAAEDPAASLSALASSTAAGSLVRTTALAAAVTAGTIAIAVPVSWLTTRTDLPLRGFWSTALSIPLVVPSYVGAYALVAFAGPGGMIDDLFGRDGGLPGVYGFGGAWLCLTLFTFPYVLLPVRAALGAMDRTLEEAARSLGSGRWEAFRRVTLPQLRPAIAAGGLLVALYTLSDFGAVSIMRFDSLTRVIFIQYRSAFDRTAAAAFALLLVLMALALVTLESMTRGRARYDPATRSRPPAMTELGRWRWPAFGLASTLALLSLVIPIAVIGYWLVQGQDAGTSFADIPAAAWHSVSSSGLAAVVSMAASIPVAILAVRSHSRLGGLAEKATYTGLALPGISIALALVFFAANYALPLYQTLTLLVFAYVVRFLPQAVGASRSAMLRVSRSSEEVGRSLGAGPLEVFRRITLPQIGPGVLAGGLLVWLTAMKELPATLLLSPLGYETLATRTWAASAEGFFARAAAPSLVLLAVSGVPLALLALRERAAAASLREATGS